MQVVNDFGDIMEGKADLMQLVRVRDDAENQLQELHKRLQMLAKILGDPKAAAITRQLSRDARCVACRIPALMEQHDPNANKPPMFPTFRPTIGTTIPSQPDAEDDVCTKTWTLPAREPDKDVHACQRWVGGSHTLLSPFVTREHAQCTLEMRPVKRFLGTGTDGKLYNLEEECMPCKECNVEKIPGVVEGDAEHLKMVGGGDQVRIIEMSDAPQVVTLKAADLVPMSSQPRGKRGVSGVENDIKEYEFKKEEVGYRMKGHATTVNAVAEERAVLVKELREHEQAMQKSIIELSQSEIKKT
ncbi:uncharacterized protein LOC113239669 [Hyposmocoma kahamanoa]|uniref:uncharacterized protein LOC113239669 n=1 Tax=Hyposmocoma kahamanoa TaxID=1477025 RepID=UPI000E6D6C7F|nr:uncharacterized protein LOC113239669 [Hyposmocoma kahamanoa]